MGLMQYLNSKIKLHCFVMLLLIQENSYAISFSDLWKNSGGTLLEKSYKTGPHAETKQGEVPVIKISQGLSAEISSDYLNVEGVVLGKSAIVDIVVDGRRVEFNDDGEFEVKIYVPIGDSSIIVQAFDAKGGKGFEIIKVKRKLSSDGEKVYKKLAPVKRENNGYSKNSVALLIGISDYKDIAEAPWAENDAKLFYDYVRGLGVMPENIKLLTGSDSDMRSMWKAFVQWLPTAIEPNESDVYIFFAGHGLATPNGDDLYLIPWDGDPELLEITAINRDEIIEELVSYKPKNITLFLDSCYSGVAKGGKEMLVSNARALRVVPKNNKKIPSNVALFTAAAGNEIASSHPDLNHGLFSYWLMRGLGGDADSNRDKKVTAGELNSYVSKNVRRDAVAIGRTQTPQFVGDSDRVIVSW